MATPSAPPSVIPNEAGISSVDAEAHRRAVAMLQERERELAQLIDMVPSHIWRLAPDGEPTFFNKPMVDFLGLDVADIARPGMSKLAALLATVVHPDDVAQFSVALDSSLLTGEALETKYRLRRADNTYRWMSSRASPLRDNDGRIIHWYGLCHDIDDLVKAEDGLRSSARQLQQIVDAVPVSIWCATPEGRFSYMNRRYQDFLGFTQEELEELTQLAEADTIPKRVHPEDVDELVRNLSSCFRTGTPFIARYRIRGPDGSWCWTEGRAEALRDEAGAIVQWYGAALDIDEEVRAQEALREREQELSQLVNMVPSYIWRLGADGEPTFFNQRLIDYFGLDIGEYDKPDMVRLAAAINTFVHPDDAANVEETLQHSLASGENFGMKYRLRRADGVYRWMAARAEPMRDPAGRIVQWYGLVQDIDDELRAQEALRDSERLLRQLVETLPAMIDCAAPDGEPIYRSRGLSEYLGYQLEELDGAGKSRLASTLDGGVHPDDVEGVKRQYAHSLATGEPYMRKHRLRRFDGEYRWVETRAAAMRNVDGTITQWSVICLDIDEEVRAQQALRDREREMSQLVAMLPSYVWRLTPEGEPNFFNKRLLDLLGIDGVDTIAAGLPSLGAIMSGVIHPDDASGLAAGLNRSLVSGEPFSMRYRMRRADGAYRWMSGHAEPMRDEMGQIIQWYGISHDINDQLRAEEVLRESERHLQQLIDALPTLIWATTPDGEPSYLNKRLVKQVGLTLDDLDQPDRSRLQSAIRDSVHPDDASGVQQGLFHSFTSGEPFAMRYRHRRADGVYHWMDTRAEPQRDPDGRIVQWYGVMFDIDDQVRAQEELRRTRERLAVASQAASLAELSASIAHEVNQPLAAVIANSHACQRWLGGESPNIQRATLTVERIIRDANAAAEVVRRIRALFKQSTEARSSFQIQLIIAEATALMMADAARKRIVIQTELADVPELVFDRVQLQQVLVNLLRNGIEAIEDGEGPRSLAVRAQRSGDEVRVEVSDSGGGLTHPDRIFEPFFTTKESGMGMGLSICRSIVESHGGKLWAEANDLNGTTFVFTLPLRSVEAT